MQIPLSGIFDTSWIKMIILKLLKKRSLSVFNLEMDVRHSSSYGGWKSHDAYCLNMFITNSSYNLIWSITSLLLWSVNKSCISIEECPPLSLQLIGINTDEHRWHIGAVSEGITWHHWDDICYRRIVLCY